MSEPILNQFTSRAILDQDSNQAQGEPGLAHTPVEITAAWKTGTKLKETDPQLHQLFDKLWYTKGSEKILYTAYSEGSAPLDRSQFKLFRGITEFCG